MIRISQKEEDFSRARLSINNTMFFYGQRHVLLMEPAYVALVLAEDQRSGEIAYNLLGSGLMRGYIFSLLTQDLLSYSVTDIPREWAESNALGISQVQGIKGVQVWARPDSVVWINTKKGTSEVKSGDEPFQLGDLTISIK